MSGDTLLYPTSATTESSVTIVACWWAECLYSNELAVVAAPSNGARARYLISIGISANATACPSTSVQKWEVLLQSPGHFKADWDPTKHPRWPAGSPGRIGGEFAPIGSTTNDSSLVEPKPKLLPAQLTIPAPFEIPEIPLPSEVLPAPLLPPNISPLHIPQNPYPGRPRCVKEWADAKEDCLALWTDGLLGKDRYRGMGRTVAECMMGRVSQDCGGNRHDA